MKWLALVAVVILVILLAILLRPSDPPDRPDVPGPGGKGDPAFEPAPRDVPPDPVAPGGPASIEVIVSRDGKPAAARIEVRSLDMDPGVVPIFSNAPLVVAGDAGPDGRLLLTDLPLGGYEVTARAPDGVRAWGRAFCRPRRPAGRTYINLRGGPAGLAGRAVYEDGSPFRGYVSVTQGMDRLAQEVTGDDGRFLLTGLPTGSVALTFVHHEEFSSHFGDVRVPKSTEEIFVVDAGLTAFTGRVVADDNGEPVAGADVRASGSTPMKGPGRGPFTTVARGFTTAATSDEDGVFRFRLPAKTAFFVARAEGFEPTRMNWSGEGDPVVRMLRPATLSGRVVQKDGGAPVAGAHVRAWNWKRYATKADFAVTDVDGRFAGLAGPGRGMIYVLGGGWVSVGVPAVTGVGANPLYVEVEQGEHKEIVIEVIPTIRAEGVVLHADGTPAAGIPVLVNQRGETRGILGKDLLVTTDPSGAFRFVDLVPGYPYRFKAGVAGKPYGMTEVMTADAGELLSVSITLPAERWLPVRFTDGETGAAIEGVRVSARIASGQHVGERASGPDGRLRVGPIGPGDLRLYIRHVDYEMPTDLPHGAGIPVADPGPEPKEIAFELSRVYRVTGRVIALAGADFEGGVLTAHPVGAEIRSTGTFISCLVKPDGTFELRGLPKGKQDLVLRDDIRPAATMLGRWTVDVPGEGIELTVDPAFAASRPPPLAIRVLGPDNLPLMRGGILIWVGDAKSPRIASLSGGKAQTDAVPKGTKIWIEVRSAKGAGGKPVGGAFHGPIEAGGREIVVHLPEARQVSGKVVGPDGKPVAGVLIEPTAVPPKGLAGRGAVAAFLPRFLSDEAGAFVLDGLGASRYRLHVDVPDDYERPSVPAIEPDTKELVISLKSAGPR